MSSVVGIPERKALIFNVQKYNIYDGPGIRTLIFFKGCPLRCKWCANPEGLERRIQVMLKNDVCINCGRCVGACPLGIHQFSKASLRHIVDRTIQCIGCRKCVEVCPTRAIEIMGEEKTISELMEIIREDRVFYEQSGGGVTLGGGEVTAQPEAALSLLQACKREGIHTAIETSGYVQREKLIRLAEFVDLFLYDIKIIDTIKHNKWTGVHNERILDNLELLLRGRHHVKIRLPLLKGVNDALEDIEGIAQFLLPYKDFSHFEGIDLLPYHKMGVAKYKQLELEYAFAGDPSLSTEDLKKIKNHLKQHGFEVRAIKH